MQARPELLERPTIPTEPSLEGPPPDDFSNIINRQPETSEISHRSRALAVLGAGVLAVSGGQALLAPDAAEARLGGVGPALSSDRSTANKQFDWFLDKTGPDGVMAQQLERVYVLRPQRVVVSTLHRRISTLVRESAPPVVHTQLIQLPVAIPL